jgi:hypothetical protein
VSLLTIKLKGRQFDTVEVIKAEFQAVLNVLTELDFQNVFRNGRIAGWGVYTLKGSTSKGMVANMPKDGF